MGKKSKKKRSVAPAPSDKGLTYVNNIIVALALLVLLYILYQAIPGYKWLVDKLVVANLEIILNNPNLDTERKYEAKLGADYRYIHYVEQNTPENAVILMPPRDVFKDSDFNKGTWGVKSREWDTYFLYPRVLISEDQKDVYPELYKKITHVMIINQWGYDKLKYGVSTKHKYNVLPVASLGN